MRWKRRTKRVLAAALLVLIVTLAVLTSFYHRQLWTQLLRHADQTRDLVSHQHPYLGFAVGLIASFLLSLVPGLAGKSLVIAWLYGFWRSLLIVNISMSAAALVEFWITRYCFRDDIEARFGAYVQHMNSAIERDGPFYLFSGRVAHVPYTLTNCLMGATSMRWVGFWWATQLGLLPTNIVYCYAGSRLPALHEIAEHGLGRIFTPQIILAFVAIGIFPFVARALLRKVRRGANHERHEKHENEAIK